MKARHVVMVVVGALTFIALYPLANFLGMAVSIKVLIALGLL